MFRDKKLLAIVAVGLLLRIVFFAVGAKVYYGATQSDIYTNGDSHSYIWAFENLLQRGVYTFDFLEPDAAFGRLPGYPFFFGIHYLIFGPEHAHFATAVSQTLLDTVAIVLVFLNIRLIFPKLRLAPYVGAVLYAFYPFVIIWVTIMGTETLAVFVTLLWLYLLLRNRAAAWHWLLLGAVCALALYIREYLGILLALAFFFIVASAWINRRTASTPWLRNCVLVGVGFAALYVWWPVRNYVSYNRVILLKTKTAGYANYNIDFNSFRGWVHGWTNNEQAWLDSVSYAKRVEFPKEIFANEAEQREAERLAGLAKTCGSSFYLYRTKLYGSATYRDVAAMKANREYQNNCNEEISAGFDKLKASYAQRNPLSYWTKVPLQNLGKAFFKSSKASEGQQGAKQLLIKALFLYRTVLLLLGVVALWVFRRNWRMLPVLAFWAFMMLFLSVIMRNLEMRYLLQADVLMLLPAAALIGQLLERTFARPKTVS